MKYEDLHRELQEALSTAAEQYRVGTDPEDSVAVISADRRLALFQERTSPLVDELVAAVREVPKLGAHDGPCQRDEDGKCILHIAAFEERCQAVEAALAALDEAADGA